MSNSVGYDKYFFNQGDYVRSKRTGSYDKVPNHPNQNSYIQSVHNASSTPRNELSGPCIFKEVAIDSTSSSVTLIFKLTDCQLLYYKSKGVVIGASTPYSCASKSGSINVIYPCTLRLFTAQDLNNIYKTSLPSTCSYIQVVITKKTYDYITMPITIDMLIYETCKRDSSY